MDIIALLIQLAGGALGGNIAGRLLKALNLGTLGNSIVGIVGGGVGRQILEQIVPDGAWDSAAIIKQILGSSLGGGILTVIVAVLRNAAREYRRQQRHPGGK